MLIIPTVLDISSHILGRYYLMRHHHISLGANGILTAPQASHRLLLRVELDTGLAVESVRTTTRNALLVPGEREHRQRHRDGDVNADLSGLDILLEARSSRPRTSEDGSAVTVLVLVDQVDGVVERVDGQTDKDRPEDLLPVAAHFGGDVGDDGGADEVPVGVLLVLVATAVEEDRSALLFGAGDQLVDSGLLLRADDGAEVGALFESAVDVQGFGPLDHLREPVLGLADGDERAQSHAALAGRTEGGAHNGVQALVLVGVRKESRVVLRSQVGLHTLAIGRTAGVDVFTCAVATDEANGLDGRLVQDEVDGLRGPVDDVDHTRGHAGFLAKLRQDHGGAGVPLGRLHHQAVTGDRGNRDTPEGNHSGEVCSTVSIGRTRIPADNVGYSTY